MSLRNALRSLLLNLFFSSRRQRLKRRIEEIRRKLRGRRHLVSVFLQIDDPYSYLLSHYLPSLASQYDIDLRLYLSQASGGDYQPAPELLAEYSVTDCARLARELGVPFLDKGQSPPTEHRIMLADTVAASAGSNDFNEALLDASSVFWRGDCEAAARRKNPGNDAGKGDRFIAASRKLQKRLGHYNSAMLHYAGEWYWGVDRLSYLMDRLDKLGAAKCASSNPQLASIMQAMQINLPVTPPEAAKVVPPLELFYSIRSPYSYLCLKRIYEIVDSFGIELKLRPVLPMVMRGMKVPRLKLLYVAFDTLRIARRLRIPYGKFADPVGLRVERVLAVFQYAESEKRGRDFLLNAGIAIWSEAQNVATDDAMRKVTDRTGLVWPDVVAAMNKDDWREPVEVNRESMMDSGSWGVPTLRMENFVVWGQDRDWLLVRHLEEMCDTGNGILV